MKKYSLKELKDIVKGKALEDLEEEVISFLKNSPLKGAQRLLATLERNSIKKQKEKERIAYLYQLEKEFWQEGKIVAGLDEAGRGPLAGPVVAACVILEKDAFYPLLKDSKKLTEAQRESLYEQIIMTARDYGIGLASNAEIDKYNILNATKLAMKRALGKLKLKPDVLLLDAVKLKVDYTQFVFTKGEDRSASIAAASILAKVYRDRLMVEKYHRLYPEYDFHLHKGYGTAHHLERLKYYGPSRIHRLTFKGVLTDELKDFSSEALETMKKMISSRRIDKLETIIEWVKDRDDFSDKEKEFLQRLFYKLRSWWKNE